MSESYVQSYEGRGPWKALPTGGILTASPLAGFRESGRVQERDPVSKPNSKRIPPKAKPEDILPALQKLCGERVTYQAKYPGDGQYLIPVAKATEKGQDTPWQA